MKGFSESMDRGPAALQENARFKLEPGQAEADRLPDLHQHALQHRLDRGQDVRSGELLVADRDGLSVGGESGGEEELFAELNSLLLWKVRCARQRLDEAIR